MTSPTLFAIFMLCFPDLLICLEAPKHETKKFTDRDVCKEFVIETVEYYNSLHEGESVLLGKCVWRIVEEK